jgi:cyclic peptide transporter
MRKKCVCALMFDFKMMIFIILFFVIPFALPFDLNAMDQVAYTEIREEVKRLMEQGDIPGLSLVIIKGDEVFKEGYGYADVEKKLAVTPQTLFEIASCSKAFTALAALQLEKQGLLNLDNPVSKYFPWFYATFKGKKYPITIRQLLHQTSGIPFKSISLIPRGKQSDSLEQTVRNLVGIKLNNTPGTQFEYATVNYSLLGAVLEKASGMSYEEYMEKHVFSPLGLTATLVGVNKETPPAHMAQGYKIGFFSARKYDAPVFWGNNPAGYIISNGNDMSRWLQLQLGLLETDMKSLIQKSQQPDETVPLNRNTLSSYGMGWFVYLKRFKRIDHGGQNPNFTAFVSFNPVDKIGVAVLANSSSKYTPFIANSVMNNLSGKGFFKPDLTSDDYDNGCSMISFISGFFLICVFAFLISIVVDLIKGRREYRPLTGGKIVKLLSLPVIYLPLIFGLYLVPRTLMGLSMETALIFAPLSFQTAILLILASMVSCYLGFVLSLIFPHKNKYFRSFPLVLVLSLLSGGANAVVIFLITTSVFSRTDLFYQLYNFTLAFFIYILGRKVLQTKLIHITFSIIYDLRLKLIEKIFYTSYQNFEKIEEGRVLATLSNDTGQIGGSANLLVQLITNAITTVCVFVYLATIAFWATLLTLAVVGTIATLYIVVTQRTRIFLEEARDTQNVYLGLLNGLIDGFKELSLHYFKKKEYKKEIADSCDKFRNKSATALTKFVNVFLIGESLLIIVLGAVGYGMPRLFPDIAPLTLMAFIMVLLYLIGPINAILNAIPAIQQLKVSWDRVQKFIKDIPANLDPQEIEASDHSNPGSVEYIKAQQVIFEYEESPIYGTFKVGPVDFEAKKGEIVFIVGGNGSGKTTLAKILTGLYIPGEGKISIDGKEINNCQLGEYYSTVFSGYHLFEKLYNVDLKDREREIWKYLKLLKLEEKVAVENNAFSTIDLSGGQKKRLALLQCYLEDRPIYLFDEIAADQDPEFRKFFYRDLLKRMKERGKIVIAITHDDHYFDAADRIIKMDMGRIETAKQGSQYMLTNKQI